ncbi:hypothetical protein [Stenotrophomonas phage BUCTxx99]|nr:hypothetical protein [Stenotrophomonas phage BUCTxx99]
MSRYLSAEEQAALLATAMRVDVSQYSPLETFIEANDRAPTVSELATYIADIRVTEAVAIANRIAKVQEDDENQSA